MSSDDASGKDLKGRIAPFQIPVLYKSLAQVLTSFGGFFIVCAAMYAAAEVSYWVALALAPVAAGFLIRIFIIQHDCGHGAFFASRRMNTGLGLACSLLTLAPYLSWRRQHAGHHGVWNNLDRRNTGVDIYSTCLTVDEYRSLSPWRRRWYRVSRSAIIANIILPPMVFLVLFRLPFDMPAGWRRERVGVYLTNLALVALIGGAGLIFGFGRIAAVQLPIIFFATAGGVWLFTVQHRAEHTIWAREKDWTATKASLRGSTYLQLPALLQWFTGNIGLHHVHHLNPRIPNYRLQECHDTVAALREVPVVRLSSAFGTMFNVLWDERQQKIVTFRKALEHSS